MNAIIRFCKMDTMAQESHSNNAVDGCDQPCSSTVNEANIWSSGASNASGDNEENKVQSTQQNEKSADVKCLKKVFPSRKTDDIILENEELKKQVEGYEKKVSDLQKMVEMYSAGSKGDIVSENLGLKKRNNMLLTTNSLLCQKSYDLNAKMSKYESEITKLNAIVTSLREECESSKQCGSHEYNAQNQPVGDSDCSIACNSMSASDKKDDNTEVFFEGPTKEQLRGYLAEYYNTVKVFQNRNQTLEQQLSESRKTVGKQHVAMGELFHKLKNVQEERDKLAKARVLKATTSLDDSQTEFPPTTTDVLLMKQEHDRNLISEYEKKIEELDGKLQSKENHSIEQEEKMEKLLKEISFIESDKRELEKQVDGMKKQTSALGNYSLNMQNMTDECRRNKEKERMMSAQIETLTEKILQLQSQLTARENEVSREVYEVQLKAFQDDWMAEHEEKRKILEDNEKLRHQLERSHITSPPIMPTLASGPPISYRPDVHFMPSSTTIPPRTYNALPNTSTIAPQHIRNSAEVAPHHSSSPPDSGNPGYFSSPPGNFLRLHASDERPSPNPYPPTRMHYPNPDSQDRMPDNDPANLAHYQNLYRQPSRR